MPLLKQKLGVVSSKYTCVLRKLRCKSQWPSLARWQSGRHTYWWYIDCMHWFRRSAWLCGNALHYSRIVQALNETQDTGKTSPCWTLDCFFTHIKHETVTICRVSWWNKCNRHFMRHCMTVMRCATHVLAMSQSWAFQHCLNVVFSGSSCVWTTVSW